MRIESRQRVISVNILFPIPSLSTQLENSISHIFLGYVAKSSHSYGLSSKNFKCNLNLLRYYADK